MDLADLARVASAAETVQRNYGRSRSPDQQCGALNSNLGVNHLAHMA